MLKVVKFMVSGKIYDKKVKAINVLKVDIFVDINS